MKKLGRPRNILYIWFNQCWRHTCNWRSKSNPTGAYTHYSNPTVSWPISERRRGCLKPTNVFRAFSCMLCGANVSRLLLLNLNYCCTTILLLYYYTTAVLLYYWCTTILLMYYYTTAVLLYYWCTTILLLYYYTTAVLLLLLYYYTTAVLLYYCCTTILLLSKADDSCGVSAVEIPSFLYTQRTLAAILLFVLLLQWQNRYSTRTVCILRMEKTVKRAALLWLPVDVFAAEVISSWLNLKAKA